MDIDKLGRYDIVRVLGRGAMGVVYEGRDPYLERQVAIKTIRVQSVSPEAAAEFSGRFRTEARSAARLQHPNIVSVFDSGQDGETSYLVMEFIQGDDLKRHLERGVHFTPRASMKMIYDLLMALDHAHRQNVVHRDVKPANMLIEAGGKVKLADFGVARIQEPDEGNLTQLGTASVGTPRYMSPEQAQGLRVDARSDVFSAGVVLYELLTGKRPFDGENQFVVVNQIVSHPHVAATRLNPELPPAIDAVMDKALAKLPDNRYATAREFALALRAVALQLPGSPDETSTGFTLGNDGNPAGASGSGNPLAEAARAMAGTNAGAAVGATGGSLGGSSTDATQAHKVNQEIELEYWKDIRDSTEPEDFTGFLRRFPHGIYADRARRRLEKLNSPGLGDSTGSGSTGSTVNGIASGTAALMQPWAPTVAQELPPEPASAAGSGPGSTPVATAAAPARAARESNAPPVKVAPNVRTPGRDDHQEQAPSRKGLYVGLAALVLIGMVVAVVLMTAGGTDGPGQAAPSAAPAASAAASQAPLPQEPASEPAGGASAAPASGGASATAGAPAAVASALRAQASTPKAARPTPAAQAASAAAARAQLKPGSAPAEPRYGAASAGAAPGASASGRDAARAAASAASAAAAAVGAAARGRAVGPSSSGQVCADKMFVFKLACIAQQCETDAFRSSEECVTFREAARRREVNRPDG